MALINVEARQIHSKIVLYGIAHAGKTTTLDAIHATLPPTAKTDLFAIYSETHNTFFFDFEHPQVSPLRGFRIRFHLYTLPGAVFYPHYWSSALNGADAVIFVIDSRARRREENITALLQLDHYLQQHSKTFLNFPVVMQYNKSDALDALSQSALDRSYNPFLLPSFMTNARKSLGVLAPLDAACALAVDTLGPTKPPSGPVEGLRVIHDPNLYDPPHLQRWLLPESPQPVLRGWRERLDHWFRRQRPL